MQLKLTPKFVLTFVALLFFMGEAHELAHTGLGRLICGCWGERDFNGWGLCEGCSDKKPWAVASTFVGPIFTFSIMWLGVFLLSKNKTDNQKAWGFALIFANIPFGRILTASMGGGDEVYALNIMLDNYNLAWAIGLTAILLITAIPLYKAYAIIQNKNRLLWFLLFFLTPTFISLVTVLGLMNYLLAQGLLSNYWILGSPILITAWTALVTIILIATRKNIGLLTQK